jgi:hypothetical protein
MEVEQNRRYILLGCIRSRHLKTSDPDPGLLKNEQYSQHCPCAYFFSSLSIYS